MRNASLGLAPLRRDLASVSSENGSLSSEDRTIDGVNPYFIDPESIAKLHAPGRYWPAPKSPNCAAFLFSPALVRLDDLFHGAEEHSLLDTLASQGLLSNPRRTLCTDLEHYVFYRRRREGKTHSYHVSRFSKEDHGRLLMAWTPPLPSPKQSSMMLGFECVVMKNT